MRDKKTDILPLNLARVWGALPGLAEGEKAIRNHYTREDLMIPDYEY